MTYDGRYPEPPYDVGDDATVELAITLTERDAQIEKLKLALEPFAKAAEIIAKRPQDYGQRIVAIGGLADARDLTKQDFARALTAYAQHAGGRA